MSHIRVCSTCKLLISPALCVPGFAGGTETDELEKLDLDSESQARHIT